MWYILIIIVVLALANFIRIKYIENKCLKIAYSGDFIYLSGNEHIPLETDNKDIKSYCIENSTNSNFMYFDKFIIKIITEPNSDYICIQSANEDYPILYIINKINGYIKRELKNVNVMCLSKNKIVYEEFMDEKEMRINKIFNQTYIYDINKNKSYDLNLNNITSCSLSPNGSKIVYENMKDDHYSKLYLKNLKTNITRELILDNNINYGKYHYEDHPCWTPNGNKIVFRSYFNN